MNELSPQVDPRFPAIWANGDSAVNRPVIDSVDEPESLNLYYFWQVINNQRWLITACLIGSILATLVVLLSLTPLYTAKTTVLIERNDPNVVDIKQVISEPVNADQNDYYKTQYAMLKSRSLAAEVVKQQGLETNRVFLGEGQAGVGSLVAHLKSTVKQWLAFSAGSSPAPNSLEIRSGAIDRYVTDMLQVEPVLGTRLVNISFRTPDPNLSARLANAHTNIYMRRGIKLRSEATQEAQRFLEEKLIELKQRVESSEASLNTYRKAKGIVSLGDKENVVVERLADLNKKLTEAEVERIALEAQARLLRNRDYDSIPAVVASPLITTLKDQLTRLQGESANLSSQFKPGYPRLAQIKANTEEIQVRLKQEIGKIVASLESAHLAARTKENELRERAEQQKNAAFELKDASVNYAILNREAETNRQLYDSVVTRIKEVSLTSQLPNSNVFIIDQAEPPRTPTSPKIVSSLLLSALVGLMAGLGIAFLREQLDHTLKTVEDAERYLALPNLGVVPDFLTRHPRLFDRTITNGERATPRLAPGSAAEATYYSDDRRDKPFYTAQPIGIVNEAYRTLRTGILLSQAGEHPTTVLFTSAIHGEGKTDTVVNSAIKFAQTGARVLLIDADLRRPACHKILGMRQGLGVAELLSSEIESQWAVQSTHFDNLFFMASGTASSDPTELIGSKKMHETLQWASRHYDHVLVDSPPIMAVSDAMLLSTMTDGVVLVIGGRSTPRDLVKQACAKLRYARARILGMVLNRVDLNSGRYSNYRYPYDPYIEVATGTG